MVTLRSRRLESLFGAPLDKLTADHIRSLVTNGVTEEFDLDFKAELYGKSDSAKRDLAGDVASLANTAGGVVIMGVAEDEHARATAAMGVALSDAEKTRMLQIVAAGVSPMPQIDIITVPLEVPGNQPPDGPDQGQGDPGTATITGYYVIAVPRSVWAPHAVLVNDGLRFPKRNGATTRYLSEPEVAAAYRDRMAGLGAQARRSEEIEAEAGARLDRGQKAWVLVSLVPDLPGDMEVTHSVLREFEDATVAREAYDIAYGVSFKSAGVGHRRLMAAGSPAGPKATWVWAEYHSDGAGVYALEQPDLWEVRRARDSIGVTSQLVDDEMVTISVLTGLRRLAMHARDRAAAGGNALVRAHLLPSAKHALEIGHAGRFGGGDSRSKVALTGHVNAAETSASLDELAVAGPALVAVAARLIDELGQVFGIAEMGHLTRDGEIRIRYFSRDMQDRVRTWAEQVGVTVNEHTLSN